MSREYEDGFEGTPERRSRRNPRMREDKAASRRQASEDQELKVMNDAAVHPVKRKEAAVSHGDAAPSRQNAGTSRASGASSYGNGASSRGNGTSSRASGASSRGNGTSSDRVSAQSAATAINGGPGGIGISQRQERERSRRRRRRRIIAMIVAECFALVLIFGYGYFLRKWNLIQRPDFDESVVKNTDISMETEEKMKGYWTIAVFGVDARDKAIAKGTNADVNIICNINLDTGEIKLVSVFRDTYLNISKDGSYNKINQAYFLGGPEQAVQALNRNLDLNITDYMTFNWKAVADAINVLGGVDVELSKAEFYYINSFITETVKATGVASSHLKSAGMNHLDGVQAVAYGRLRLMDTDYARTERQRKVIKLAFEKAQKADFDTLNRVLGVVFPQVATSMNINDLFTSLKMINRYQLGETTGFPQARGDANMGRKGAVVVPQTLESNVVKLHEFLFGDEAYTPSDTVKSISAKIASDTGMYTEGKYVDHVDTDGGVIQKPKETQRAAETDADEESSRSEESTKDGEKYATIYVLDKNGKRVKKSVAMETDADGEYIEPETNASGLAVGWSLDEDGKLKEQETDEYGEAASPTTKAAETDENGDPVESESSTELRPGHVDPAESGSSAPSETDAHGRPITTEPGGTSSRPGESTGSSGTLRPGYLDPTETSAASHNPTTGTLPGAPGGTTTTPSPSASGGTTNNSPGSSTSPTSASVSQGPGSGSSSASPSPGSSGGPGASGSPGSDTGTIVPSAGVVAGPGQ